MPPTEVPPTDPYDNVYDLTTPRRDARGGWEREAPAFDPVTARAIAHIVRTIRPAWAAVEVMAALEDCAELPLPQVVKAAVNLACDARVQHPSRLSHPGPHWDEDSRAAIHEKATTAALARARGSKELRTHNPAFLTTRCRAYLAECRDRATAPDALILAGYAAEGVDVESVRAEVYRD